MRSGCWQTGSDTIPAARYSASRRGSPGVGRAAIQVRRGVRRNDGPEGRGPAGPVEVKRWAGPGGFLRIGPRHGTRLRPPPHPKH